MGDFFKFLWTFQKSWALPHTYLVLSTYFANDHPSQDLSLKKTNNESLEFRRTIKCWYAIRTFLSRGATLYIVFQMLWNFRFIVGIDAFEIFHVFLMILCFQDCLCMYYVRLSVNNLERIINKIYWVRRSLTGDHSYITSALVGGRGGPKIPKMWWRNIWMVP